MFLRKLTVMVLPLLLCLAVCMLLPMLQVGGVFLARVLSGMLLGIALAFMLPLAGATKKHEPFAGLMVIPAVVLTVLMVVQYMLMSGTIASPMLAMLVPDMPNTVMVESAFAAYLYTTCLRWVG